MPDRPEKSVLAPYRSKLGKVPDQQIADQAKVSRTLVVNYRKKLGIPAYQGHKSAPTPARARGGDARPFRGRRSALDAYADKLGTVPDAEIAKLAGVTAENVRTYRRRRNIVATWQVEGESSADAPRGGEAPVSETPSPKRARPSRVRARTEGGEAPAEPAGAPPEGATASRAAAQAAGAPATTGPAASGDLAGAGTAYLVTVDTPEGARSYALIASDIAVAAFEASTRVATRHPGGAIRSIQRVADVFPE